MLIAVLTEPNFRSYLWARQTLAGITQEAARRKYRLVTLDADAYEEIDYDHLFGQERRMLIVTVLRSPAFSATRWNPLSSLIGRSIWEAGCDTYT